MTGYQLIHHGAACGVTGSCHELRLGADGDFQDSLLVDCGLVQGEEAVSLGPLPWRRVGALVLTHAHLDHIGRLPELSLAGWHGPVYCSEATAALEPLMLADGLLQQGRSRGWVAAFLADLQRQMRPLPFGAWHRVALSAQQAVHLQLQPAGHILGSASITVRLAEGQRLVFSGDIGGGNSSLLRPPVSPAAADLLVLESTYGDRLHPAVALRHQALRQVVERSLRDGGAILIPAFSIGRTQELLSDLEQILCEVQATGQQSQWQELPVVLDSPLGAQVTRLYRQFRRHWRREAQQKLGQGRHPLDFSQAVTLAEHGAHLELIARLQATGEPVIVVAGGGMCQGGRIVDYLSALLPDPRTDVLLCGFQARGTPGAQLQVGVERLWLDGQSVPVAAQIHRLSGYSAHADQAGLIEFVAGMASPPKAIRLVHGEPEAQRALAKALQQTFPGLAVDCAAQQDCP